MRSAIYTTKIKADSLSEIVKLYGSALDGQQRRYSPAKCNGTKKIKVTGKPEHKHVLTSYVEQAEPQDPLAHAPIRAADKCVLKEV